jgi:hypothetical protein
MDSTASLDNTPAMTPSKPSQEGATSQGQVPSSCFLVLRGWVMMGERGTGTVYDSTGVYCNVVCCMTGQ